ncbi:MAG: penicillin-insensitive murein endopeptidase, partial [Byssovorax sp.]
LAAFAIALSGLGVADAKPAKKHATTVASTTRATKGSRHGAQSVGAPNAGHLAGAMLLKGSRTLKQKDGSHSWALPELVRVLQRASAKVAKKHKSSVMLVGDLSGRTGGFLERHGSHQSGRDADVGFYVMNSKGKSVNVRHFVAFDGSGKGRELTWATFDDARNWDLVEALLQDDKANVRYLFVSPALRGKLLAQAARKHARPEIIARAAAAMMSPQEADAHDDHVHVRIGCPEAMRDVCIEEAMPRVGGGDAGPAKSARAADADRAEEKASEAKPAADAPPGDVASEAK